MRIIRTRDYNHMSEHAAAVIAAQLTLQPNSTLGLATGSTPLGAYVRLVEMCAAGKISFAQVQSYNLDEYRGLTHDDPQSYHHFMWENLFSRVDIDVTRTHVPDGSNEDAASTCANYDAAIEAAGGIDLQLLGIGNNGHIGFNEPGDEFVVGTHCVNLTESTIKANSRLFESIDEVPRQAYTLGIGAIMHARRILVIASGTAKADAVHAMCYGPVTPACPASVLQLHPDCIVIADAAALSAC